MLLRASSRARVQYQTPSCPLNIPSRAENPPSFQPGAPVVSHARTNPICPARAAPLASESTTAYFPGGSACMLIVTVIDPLALEQKNCVSVGAVNVLASIRYTLRSCVLPPFTIGAACSTAPRIPSHWFDSAGSSTDCNALTSCRITASESCSPIEASVPRSCGVSSACVVQVAAYAAAGTSISKAVTKLLQQRRMTCVPSLLRKTL